jgi:hypothetical protein
MDDQDVGRESPQGPGIMEKLAQLREVQAEGGDVLAAASKMSSEEAPAKPNGETPPGERVADDGRAGGDEAGQEGKNFDRWGEIPPDVLHRQEEQELGAEQHEADAEKVRELLKTEEREELPAGTYKDEAGRLRDEVTHRFIRTEQLEDGAEGEVGAATEELEIELPGRREGDPPVKFTAPDQETAERLRQATNEGMRRREYNDALANLEERERSQEAFFDALKNRPADTLVQHLRPEVRSEVVERLLAAMSDEEFAAALTKATGWARAPESRNTANVMAENEALKANDAARRASDTEAANTRAVRDIGRTIIDIMPEEWDRKREDAFVKYALTNLEEYAEGGGQISTAELPALLDELGVLEPFGLDAAAAAERVASSATASPSPARSARPASTARPADAAGGKAKRAGADVRERVKRRRDASATAPSGAGAAPAGGLNPPPNQTVAERLAWAKKKFRLGRSRG